MKNTIKLLSILMLLLTLNACSKPDNGQDDSSDEENPTTNECFDFKDVTSLTGASGEILYTYFIDDNHGWVLSRHNITTMHLFYTDDGGKTFTLKYENFNIDPLTPIFPIVKFINETDGFTASVSGLSDVSYTTDKGETWNDIPNPPIFNSTFVNWKGFDSNSYQTVFMSDLSYVMVVNNVTKAVTNVVEMPDSFFDDDWHLVGRDIHLSENGIITCLFDTGTGVIKLARSSDYGATWTYVMDINGERYSEMTWPTDQIGFFNLSDKLYKTTDGGFTWEIKQSLHFDSIDFVDENLGLGVISSWVSEDGFYKTTDGGDTWTVFDCLKPDNSNVYRTGEWISFTSANNAIFPGFKSEGNFGGNYGLFYYKGE